MTIRHLDQRALALRWSISPRTLERWRWQKEGPTYLKVGGRVLYRIEDVEDFERASASTEPTKGSHQPGGAR